MVPSVVVSKEPADEDEILTSGQVSPVCKCALSNIIICVLISVSADAHIRSHLMRLARAERSEAELSEFNRRLDDFNQKNPPTKPIAPGRVVSWAGNQKTGYKPAEDSRGRRRALSPLTRTNSDGTSQESLIDLELEFSRAQRRRLQALKKRRSFDDADSLRNMRILPIERMRTDVELCGQLLVMRRREQHLANVLACLNALTVKLSASNSLLHQDYTAKQQAIEDIKARAGILQDIEEARTRADAMTQETNALAYESAQFLVDDLWHMAATPRRKVLEMREHVFGVGKRLPPGVNGAHGQYNHEQWTLGGDDRLVDALGRTESEAEEEYGLPGAILHTRENEGEVVQHANLKPTWILRMFNYWGSRWAVSGGVAVKEKDKAEEHHEDGRHSTGGSTSGTTSAIDIRNTLTRNKTS